MTIEMIEPHDAPRGWRVDKTVPVSMLVALTVQAVSTLIAVTVLATRMDSRMTSLEDSRANFKAFQKDRDERQDAALKDAIDAWTRQTDKLADKIDRVIESQRGQR